MLTGKRLQYLADLLPENVLWGDPLDAGMLEQILAAHSAGAQEPVAWMRSYRQFGDTQSAAPDAGYMVTSFHQNAEFASKYPDENTPLYAHPQPMPQTDAARDVMDHETALRGCRILSNIVSAYDEGNHGGRVIHLIGVAKSWIAEIERLDRAKGE